MNSTTITGSIIVTFALASYLTAIITEQKRKRLVRRVLIFITAGLTLDISATACMIIGSQNSPFTLHGFIGYSALLIMVTETFQLWRLFKKEGLDCEVPHRLHIYSRIAIIWWVLAYITGSMIAMMG